MARNSGGNKFKGSIGDLTYYNLKGVGPVVRKKWGPSKADIDSNPNFAVTKRNNNEFGAAAKVGKAIRLGLGQIGKEFQDTTVSGRLAGKIRKVIQQGSGTSGQRECNLRNATQQIINFPLSLTNNFSQIYQAPYQCAINNQKTDITIHFPALARHHHSGMPKYATHYKLIAALSLVANHKYNTSKNTYIPTQPQQNAIGNYTQTQALQLTETHNNISLTLSIPSEQPLLTDVTATIWLGITYLTQENNGYLPMQTQKAMSCIAVF